MNWVKDDKRIQEFITGIGDCPVCNKRVEIFPGETDVCVRVIVTVPKYLKGEVGPSGQELCWGVFDFVYTKVFCKP